MSDLKHHAFPADYEHDDGVLVPRNEGEVAFSYSDGDGPENYLLELMSASADRSLFSPDLLAGIRDWPSRYHLSPKRANLLRPFSDLLRGNILEVGAGCGAITRFLGENGARVVAVEGSPRRARITRHRTRDLDNVQVVCDRIENIAPAERFDVVTAIGVLEYAAVYGTNGSDPHISLLRCLRELLTQRGVVILAIENKLGLKYFAGAREDHTGAAFDGINDGYRPGSVATFGASELGRLLDSAGFRARTWFLPCPDYKLPTTILSASLLNRHPDLAATLAAQAAPVDPQRPADPTFSLEQAWSVLGENALLGELANSFLVIAGTCAEAVAPFQRLSDLAWHFSVDRHPAFAKETRFVNGGDGLSIERHPLTRTRPPAVPIRQVLEPEPLRRGSNWWNELVAILNRNNWTVSQIADWARVWTSALVSECGLDALNSDTFHTNVDGLYFDLAPFNMVRDANGQTHFFDREWHLTPSVEFGFVVVRGLRDSLGRVPSCATPAPGTPQTINQLVINVLAELGILISSTEIDRYAQLEGQIQAWVQGRSVSGVTADTLQAQWNASLRQRTPADRAAIASERQQQQRSIEELRGKLGGVETARASLASELEQAKAAAIRQAGEIARLEAVRVENEARIDQATRDLNGAREMARDSQSQTQRLGGELAAAQQDLARARQDYESGRAELIAASQDRDDRIDALTQQLAEVQHRLQERDVRIRAHIAERDAKAQALATALDESARAAADFAAEHARLTASTEERAGRIDTLTREIHAARARLQEREAQLQAIASDRNATLKTLAAERDAHRAALTASHAERDAHTAALAAIREQLARNIHDHHAERARLLADAQARDSRIGEIAAQLATAQRRLQERDAQFGALSAEREAQAQALAAAQHRARDNEARLGALSAERDAQLHALTAERDAQLHALTAERDAQLQALATARDTVRQDADRAAAERDAAIARLADETGRTRALTPQLEAQTARAARAEEDAARLRAERDALRDSTRAELAQREQERDAQARTAQIAQAQSEQLRATLAQQAQALAALAPPARRSPLSALRALTQRFTGWRRTDYRHQAWEAETIRASGLFSAVDYVTRYPDVAETGGDPLLHYLRSGAAEGRAPHPLFDAAYYLRQHPEAAEAKMSPLAHYVTAGVAAGFNPHPLFDTDWYLHQNPDVAETGVNPFQHYMTQGWREGRDPHPLFDSSFYLENNPDVAAGKENPLLHYCTFGWKEGRDPHPDFDTSWYLEKNEDVAESGGVPLIHYVEYGQSEGRLAKVVAPQVPISALMDTIDVSLEDIRFYPVVSPDISIIVPVYNQIAYTLRCLLSLVEQRCSYTFEVLVMDDGSSDQTLEILQHIPGLRYFRNKNNLGFNRNCNRGAELARGKYLVFLNNDTKVASGWLQALRDTFDQHGNVGIAGSKLTYEDGRLQEAGGIIWEDGSGWNWGRLQDPNHPRYNYARDVDYVSGASLMVPKQLFFDLGKFSDALQNSYYEDTWLAFAAREAGYRVIYQPKSELIHYEGITSGRSESEGVKRYQTTNRHVFFERWKERLRHHLPNATTPNIASDRLPASHILIVDACTPTPDQDSGSIDMFNFIRILQNSGRRVHFIPQTNFAHFGKYTQELQLMGAECIYAPHYRSVKDFLTERGDMFSHAILTRTPVAADVIDDVKTLAPNAKIIFYTVDMHGLREIREAELSGDEGRMTTAQATLQKELSLVERSDTAVVLSEHEAEYLRKRGHNNIAVIPLIRDTTIQKSLAAFDQRQDVVFIGGFQHTPNVDAARWLIDEIWPHVRRMARERGHPAIRLKLVGSKMPDWIKAAASEDIEPIGFVENLDDVFLRARLSIAPLRYGAGLKGKIATSLGYGVPVVGTSVAFEGMPSKGLSAIKKCADDALGIAQTVLEVYQAAQVWNSISAEGVEYVNRHFSIQSSASKIQALLAPNASARN